MISSNDLQFIIIILNFFLLNCLSIGIVLIIVLKLLKSLTFDFYIKIQICYQICPHILHYLLQNIKFCLILNIEFVLKIQL